MVCSYPEISNDPTFLIFLIKNGGVRTRNRKNRIVDSCLILCNLPAKVSVNLKRAWESIEPEEAYLNLASPHGCGFRIPS